MSETISIPSPKQLREILAAAPDAIELASGVAPQHTHPLAQSMRLRDIAFACGLKARAPGPNDTSLSMASFGLSTTDFPSLVAGGLKRATVGAYDAQAAHMAFSVPVPVESFHAVDLPALDADFELLELSESAEMTRFVGLVAGGSTKVQLRSFARKFGLTRVAMINNDLESFARAVIGTGSSAARLESRMVADALEANPVMDDGANAFATEYLNVVEAALDASSLGQALGALRKQKTAAGQLADLAGKHLVVEPDLEMTARELVRTAGLAIEVAVLAHLPAGRWYLLASPDTHPVVGVLRLLDAKWPVRVEPNRRPKDFDGAVVGTVADLGACLLRRTGIVRGEAA